MQAVKCNVELLNLMSEVKLRQILHELTIRGKKEFDQARCARAALGVKSRVQRMLQSIEATTSSEQVSVQKKEAA